MAANIVQKFFWYRLNFKHTLLKVMLKVGLSQKVFSFQLDFQLKFEYSEKASRFEKIFYLKFDVTE